MRMAIVVCVAGCAIQTSSSGSSSFGPSTAQTQAQAQGQPTQASAQPAASGQDRIDTRDTGMPSRTPPAGLSTEIALSPPPGRNNDGALVGPGGPISTAAATCGPARGHCVRGSYFANAGSYQQPGFRPVFIFEGRFYLWDGKFADQDYAYKTAPATAANLATARQAVVFVKTLEDTSHALPASEQEALLGGIWNDIVIDHDKINAAARTFTDDRDHTYTFDQARVLLDWVHAK